MPGRAPAQGGQPRQPFGPQLKAALVQAAPLFSAMAAGYSSGRGPYAYLDQGIAGMQAMQKQKRDEEAAAAAAAAFGGLVPGGMGPAGAPASAASGGGSVAPVTFDKAAPQYIADDAMAALGKEPLSMEGRIREGLKARGLPEHVANGFIANFKDESNLNPGINEAAPVVPGSRGGFGLAQWTGPRRKALEAFAASTGRPVDDLNVQLDFLMQELSGSEAGAAGAIMSAKNAPEAAAAIVNSFLRPAEEHRSRREAAYLGMEGGAPAQADPLADPYVQKLMQVMAMTGLTAERRSVVELQLQTRMGQLSAPDPNADEDRARERRARDAELLGYGRGTPEWNQYVVTGEIPAGFDQDNFTDGAPNGTMWIDPNNRAAGVKAIPGYREPVDDPLAALKARAKEGGLVEGTDAYRTFMINNGPANGMIIESTPDGGIRVVQGDAVAGAKPFTEGQSKDIVYATRAEGALATLDPIADALTSRGEVVADWLPMGLGGGMQTDEYQVAKTAGDEFLQAILRKDTGAAITTQEQALYGETYLPRPGDSPARLQYKQEARKRAVEALKGGMSPAQIIAQEKALEKAGAAAPPDTSATDADGWKTLPGGVKVRVKP